MGLGLELASWIMSTWTLCTSSPGSATATSFPYGLTVTMLLPPAAGFTFIPTRIDAFFIIHHQ